MKTRSPDWLRLATGAVNARDGLRGALRELQNILNRTTDPEIRERVASVLGVVARECDRLRAALKGRRARSRKPSRMRLDLEQTS